MLYFSELNQYSRPAAFLLVLDWFEFTHLDAVPLVAKKAAEARHAREGTNAFGCPSRALRGTSSR